MPYIILINGFKIDQLPKVLYYNIILNNTIKSDF